MAYTTIDDPSAHFHTRLYSGNGSTQSITNNANAGNFKPDWLWIKERTSTSQNFLFDSNRGVGKYLHSDSTSSEGNDVHNTSFDSNGFGVGQQNGTNENSQTYVAWQWVANGGTTSSNSNGDITSTVQTNSTAGFSIGTYTGDADNSHSVGHGLGATPAWIIVKRREGSHSWIVWHQNLTATSAYAVDLENTDAEANNTSYFHDTAPDANTFHPGDGGATNGSGGTYVFYAFKEIKGYSKFGSYKGNGNANGAFIYTGFRPAWIMVKLISGSGEDWHIFDSSRSTSNVVKERLIASGSAAENANDSILDFVSNGFKFKESNAGWNGNGNTYIYMAFAEHPFVSSKGVPVTAR
mgnify:FL=1